MISFGWIRLQEKKAKAFPKTITASNQVSDEEAPFLARAAPLASSQLQGKFLPKVALVNMSVALVRLRKSKTYQNHLELHIWMGFETIFNLILFWPCYIIKWQFLELPGFTRSTNSNQVIFLFLLLKT